jgi:hypothetical protein
VRTAGFALTAFGLAADILGAWVLARGLFILEKDAVNLTAARFAGDTLEENLRHPQAQDRLRQSSSAKIGVGVLLAGFLLQLLGAALSYLA